MASLESKEVSWDKERERYVRNMAALLFLRGINHTEHFILASGLPGVGAFGDNVLVFAENAKATACFIHLDEGTTPEEYQKVTDHLLEYFASYREILQSLPWIEQQFGSDVHNLELVYYTDAKLNLRRSCSVPDHILDTGGLTLNLVSSTSAHDFFQDLRKYVVFLREYLTCKEDRTIEKIEHFKKQVSFRGILGRLAHLQNQCTEEEATKLMHEINGLDNKRKFQTFLSKFKLFHRQAGPKDLEDIVKDEFIKVFGDCNTAFTNYENIFQNFIQKIEASVKEENMYLTPNSNVWVTTVMDMALHISEQKRKEINRYCINFDEPCLDLLRNCLQNNRVVNVLSETDDLTLSTLKVHQALKNVCHLMVNWNMITQSGDIIKLWSSPHCVVLVLESQGIGARDVRTICSKLVEVLQRHLSHQLIIVSRRDDSAARNFINTLQIECWDHVDNTAFTDLSLPSQRSLLSKKVTFQGVNTTLSSIFEPHSRIIDKVRGPLLVSVIDSRNGVVIGQALPNFPNNYFPRTLQRSTTLSPVLFRNVEDDTLLAIVADTPDELSQVLPYGEEAVPFYSHMDKHNQIYDTPFIYLASCLEEEMLKDLVDDDFTDLHCLEVKNKCIKWKWSKAGTNTLSNFILKNEAKCYACDVAQDIPDQVVLVVGVPQVGKSTLFTHLARQTKVSTPSMWVVVIDVKRHEEIIRNTLFDTQENIVSFLSKVIGLTDILSPALDKIAFTESLLETGNIVVFVDGFESISSLLTQKVSLLLRALLELKVKQIFISCRTDIIQDIQQNFHTLPYTLNLLSIEDQRSFLISKWSKSLIDVEGLGKFVYAALDLLNKTVSSKETQMSTLPLQTVMLSEIFTKELNDYVTTGIITLSTHLNLVIMYDRFVDKMCVDFLMNRNIPSVLTQNILIQNKMNLCDKYMTISLVLLLTREDMDLLDVHSLQYRYNRDLSEFRHNICTGNLLEFHNGKPRFVYPTLAEYFVGTWLAEMYISVREFIQHRLLLEKFVRVRRWFDRVLSKNCKLHNAVLNGDRENIIMLIVKGADVNKQDSGGRTALHLAAMYDLQEELKLLLIHGADTNVLDNILKWRPLKYADELECWGVVDVLLELKANSADLSRFLDIIRNETHLNKVITLFCQHGYINLINCMYYHSVDVKRVLDVQGCTALHVASKYGQNEMVQFLVRYEAQILLYGKSCRNILQYVSTTCLPYASHLLDRGTADIDIMMKEGSTPLLMAAKKGHRNTVEILLNFGANVNHRRLDGSSSLHLASAGGHTETVKCLLQAGANVNAVDNEGVTPLSLTASKGHTNAMFHLLQKDAYVNSVDNLGKSALHQAASIENEECLRWLIQSGADVNRRDLDGSTPLHCATRKGHQTAIQLLLEFGANATIVDKNDATPVHIAAKQNSVSILKIFSACGENMNVTNGERSTPLHWACRKGNTAAVKCLLDVGAKTDICNKEGFSALHVATGDGHVQVVRCLLRAGALDDLSSNYPYPVVHAAARQGHTQILRCLIDAGVDLNVSDKAGSSALHWAAWTGRKEAVDLLLSAGARCNAPDNNGSSPLHWAAAEGNTAVILALLRAGAYVDSLNKDNESPLHWAAKEGHLETVKVLVGAGINVNAANVDGATPLQLASVQPHQEIIDYLEKNGSNLDIEPVMPEA